MAGEGIEKITEATFERRTIWFSAGGFLRRLVRPMPYAHPSA